MIHREHNRIRDSTPIKVCDHNRFLPRKTQCLRTPLRNDGVTLLSLHGIVVVDRNRNGHCQATFCI